MARLGLLSGDPAPASDAEKGAQPLVSVGSVLGWMVCIKRKVEAMTNPVMVWMHGLAHFGGWNTGTVYSWWDHDTGALTTGFRCAGCPTIQNVQVAVSDRHWRNTGSTFGAYIGETLPNQGNPIRSRKTKEDQ